MVEAVRMNEATPNGSFFSDRQRRIIASALTLACFVLMAAIIIGLGRLVIRFFQFFSGVFLPLAVAGILAVMLKPYYDLLARRIHSRVVAVILVLLSLAVPLLAISLLFGAIILEQVKGLATAVPVWIRSVVEWSQQQIPWLKEVWSRHGLDRRLEGFLSSHGEVLTTGAAEIGVQLVHAGHALFRSIAGILSWAVLPVYFIFFLMAPRFPAEKVAELTPFLKTETRNDLVELARQFATIIVGFFRGQFVIALLQGLLYGIGFAIVGLKYGLLLGLMFGLINIIPYLGNVLGLLFVLPLAYFQEGGGWFLVLGTGVVFGITQLIEGYVLTPKIMGDQTGLHPGVIVFAMFFWGTALGGILGMILAIPLTAFLVVLWRLLRSKYIDAWI